MKLEDLLKDIEIILLSGPKDVEIKGLEYDSRNVKEGDLLVCINGANVNGHKFIESAKAKGAVAFVIEEDVQKDDNLTYIKVRSTNEVISTLGRNFYKNPSEKIQLIGVTGTNGKTSVSSFLKDILSQDEKCGFIGTIGIFDGKNNYLNKNTTPNNIEIQKSLNNMINNDCKYCTMEVSSHALALKRVENMKYKIGIFTNLTEDHLDFHKTFENYRKAKESLFYMTTSANIINIDDINGRIILDNIKTLGVPYYTYGINYGATFRAKDVKLYEDKTVFTLHGPNDFQREVSLNMVGQFTVYNCLAVICACYILNMDVDEIVNRISILKGVNGRFEKVENNKDIHVFVDYAHTPDALDNVLNSIKDFAKKRIITVFGCGGNREKEKRPLMGKIAQEYSDIAIITSDNPRYEEPNEIIKDILIGIDREKENYVVILDRKDAIKEAINMAKEGDVVLIAGKGHENYQIIKDEIVEFDDKLVAKEILDSLVR
ncbi:UDP-N-acetylmuramoyl-L-alanyl-D-glutamate--2,6-diaminopimelate ligase [Terrisporobacter petrolearius]|uniref:UDP-N-acetylmuramoyl-L-alanyl-D-glutamate--2, 6-diaminopimelate ligase n=1 Tax=Terrisporobacter petrolearius TaxID=1460447 RepID=UPI001D165E66|nr:UDP-N-acetylmuramoyl-L-alanyl-D-glutamate--2,6-diaminopimelate ligase [Terrisporobacter petrolearius]